MGGKFYEKYKRSPETKKAGDKARAVVQAKLKQPKRKGPAKRIY